MVSNRLASMVVAVTGAAIVAGLFTFNRGAGSYNLYLVGNMMGLAWIPVLVILFGLKDELASFGLTMGTSRRVWVVVGALFAGLVVLMAMVCRWQAFQDYYPIFRRYPEFARAFRGYPETSPWAAAPALMVFAEASYGMYLFAWEFFFRGYLLFGLSRSIGWWAVVAQAAAFGLLHFGKPTTELAASFGAGAILGIIALNARSFVPCFLLHWAASMTFDFLVVGAR